MNLIDICMISGILSFFAIQAGAKHVYAIEASSIVNQCQVIMINMLILSYSQVWLLSIKALVKGNNLSDKITVIAGKVEEVLLVN